jgi:hypothetical protein
VWIDESEPPSVPMPLASSSATPRTLSVPVVSPSARLERRAHG